MPSDNIRESIENARRYLSEHPDEAHYTDQPATAVIEDGLRCRVEHTDGSTVVWAVRVQLPARAGFPERLRPAATPR